MSAIADARQRAWESMAKALCPGESAMAETLVSTFALIRLQGMAEAAGEVVEAMGNGRHAVTIAVNKIIADYRAQLTRGEVSASILQSTIAASRKP